MLLFFWTLFILLLSLVNPFEADRTGNMFNIKGSGSGMIEQEQAEQRRSTETGSMKSIQHPLHFRIKLGCCMTITSFPHVLIVCINPFPYSDHIDKK